MSSGLIWLSFAQTNGSLTSAAPGGAFAPAALSFSWAYWSFGWCVCTTAYRRMGDPHRVGDGAVRDGGLERLDAVDLLARQHAGDGVARSASLSHPHRLVAVDCLVNGLARDPVRGGELDRRDTVHVRVINLLLAFQCELAQRLAGQHPAA